MLHNSSHNIAHKDCSPRVKLGRDPSVLTSIYEENVNIVVWQRERQDILEQYASQWVNQYPSHTPRILLPAQNPVPQLTELLPDINYVAEFTQDLVLLIDMFACLFEAQEVGLRIAPLTAAMCPRFHVDNIPCRLVATYGGLGTQWLSEDNIDRRRLGRGAGGLSDNESGIFKDDKAIEQLDSQHVGLLKGSGWIGNEKYGLVHRSPHLQPGQSRLLVTLDCL